MIRQAEGLRIQKITTREGFSRLRDHWNALLEASPASQIFLKWEWLSAWWEAYQTGRDRLLILLISTEEDLIGIAPFYVTERSWKNVIKIRRLLFLGTTEESLISEYMDLICRSGDEGRVLKRVIDYVVEENLCDDLSLHSIPTSSKTLSLLQELSDARRFLCIIGSETESPYINLPCSIEVFLSGCKSSLRHQIRNQKRKLMSFPDVRFRKTSHLSELEGDFREFIRLHQHRWESRHLPGSFSEGRFPLFQRRIMGSMLETGELELRFLSIEGRNIAALYNIRYKDRVYYYQSGMDLSFDPTLAPGLLLHAHAIEEAIRDGMKKYDFLMRGSGDSYKKRWTGEYQTLCNIYLARPGILKVIELIRNKAKVALSSIRRTTLLSTTRNRRKAIR